jgi:orotate phosphoribosyltransferase
MLLGSPLKDGDRVVVVEDVTTSGKSMEETIPIIKAEADIKIVGLMVSLNRCEKGKGDKGALDEIKDLYGFDTAAIVAMDEIVDYLVEKGIIDTDLKGRIDAYYDEYGIK